MLPIERTPPEQRGWCQQQLCGSRPSLLLDCLDQYARAADFSDRQYEFLMETVAVAGLAQSAPEVQRSAIVLPSGEGFVVTRSVEFAGPF